MLTWNPKRNSGMYNAMLEDLYIKWSWYKKYSTKNLTTSSSMSPYGPTSTNPMIYRICIQENTSPLEDMHITLYVNEITKPQPHRHGEMLKQSSTSSNLNTKLWNWVPMVALDFINYESLIEVKVDQNIIYILEQIFYLLYFHNNWVIDWFRKHFFQKAILINYPVNDYCFFEKGTKYTKVLFVQNNWMDKDLFSPKTRGNPKSYFLIFKNLDSYL